jgi:hypothetical protein
MRFVCQQFFIVSVLSLFCALWLVTLYKTKFLVNVFYVFVVQEIKFEPCVMCEHLDKRTSFRSSQVYRVLNRL